MSMRTAAAALLLALAAPALAADGAASILPGDSARGVLGPGETDRITFQGVFGQRLSADLRSEFEPELRLRIPSGAEVDLSGNLREGRRRATLRRFVLPATGTYAIEVHSRDPVSGGSYRLRTRAWAPRGTLNRASGTPGVPLTLPLGDLPGGATASLRARGGTLVSLEGPGGPLDAGGGRAARLVLPGTGSWGMVVAPGAGGSVAVSVSLAMPRGPGALRDVLDAPPAVTPPQDLAPPPTPSAPVVVLVRMRDGSDGGAFDGRHGCSTGGGVDGTSFVRVTVPDGADPQAFLDEISRDGDVAEAERIFVSESPEGDPSSIPFTASDANRNAVSQQASFALTNVLAAQAIADGTGVIVAVLDTGILPGTPDLVGHLLPGFDLVDGDADPTDGPNGIDDDSDGQVDEGVGHGTFVAGLVAAIAPGAKILPVRVLDSDARGTSEHVALGIVKAVDAGARIVNLSLGVKQPSAVIQDAINYAKARNVLIVAAAGNANLVDTVSFPASLSNVLSVTAVNSTGVKAAFSNAASSVAVSAPGVDVLAPFRAGGYATWSGTSFSAPFASAGAALVLSHNPGMRPTDAGKTLVDTAVSVNSLNPAFQGLLGRGRIDLLRAVKAK